MHFWENVYGFNFFVFYRDDPKLEKFKKRHKIDLEASGFAQTSFHVNCSPYYNQLVLFTFDPEFKEKPLWRQVEVIAHEAWHATELCLFYAGCGVNLDNVNEHLAYYVGFVARKLTKLLL